MIIAESRGTCNVGDLGSIPELGRFPGKRKDYPLQYSDLENSMDCIVRLYSPSGCKELDMTEQLSLSRDGVELYRSRIFGF